MLETFCQSLSTSSTNIVHHETVYEQVLVLVTVDTCTWVTHDQGYIIGHDSLSDTIVSRGVWECDPL